MATQFDSIFGKLDDVIHMPLEQQAKYSDSVCRFSVNSNNPLRRTF